MEEDQFEAAMIAEAPDMEAIEALKSERTKRSEFENAEAKRRRDAEEAEAKRKAEEEAAKHVDEIAPDDEPPMPKD